MEVSALLKESNRNLLPPERIEVSGWAAKYYQLPETSAEPGRWSPHRAPYQADIMDAICEPGV